MNNVQHMNLVELNTKDQQKTTGGIKIGSLSITTSIITADREVTETKGFSIHWDESGISIQIV